MLFDAAAVPAWTETEHEQVVFAYDQATGLRAILAVHSTVLGPSLGGARWYPYGSTEEAVGDVLRLSEAMSYKAAAAGLPLGGGKAVLIGDPARQRSDAVLEAYARMVESLGGRYITAEDVGTTVDDMRVLRRSTVHVSGLPLEDGGSGDPSPATARGVSAAIRATVRHVWGETDPSGRRVVVVGVGKVGSALVDHLVDSGCNVVVADIDDAAVRRVVARHDIEVADVAEAMSTPCDILSPTALGGSLNTETIASLRCEAIVGAANNQLHDPEEDLVRLRDRGILYVPDFVVNAGGLINIAEEIRGYDPARAATAVERIGETVESILRLADEQGTDTYRVALALARERIAAGRQATAA